MSLGLGVLHVAGLLIDQGGASREQQCTSAWQCFGTRFCPRTERDKSISHVCAQMWCRHVWSEYALCVISWQGSIVFCWWSQQGTDLTHTSLLPRPTAFWHQSAGAVLFTQRKWRVYGCLTDSSITCAAGWCRRNAVVCTERVFGQHSLLCQAGMAHITPLLFMQVQLHCTYRPFRGKQPMLHTFFAPSVYY
jgi:hypothetical protein